MSIPDETLARWAAWPRPGAPGPWVVSTDHGDESAEIVCMAPGHPDYLKDIALRLGCSSDASQAWEEDFKAIASLPEMREAIDVLVAEVRELREQCDRARAAFLELSEGRP